MDLVNNVECFQRNRNKHKVCAHACFIYSTVHSGLVTFHQNTVKAVHRISFIHIAKIQQMGDAMCLKWNTEARSPNNYSGGKNLSIAYSEYVNAPLVIQPAKRMRCIRLSYVACLATPYFPHYLINDTMLGNKL